MYYNFASTEKSTVDVIENFIKTIKKDKTKK